MIIKTDCRDWHRIPRTRHHCQHLASDMDQYTKNVMDGMVDKTILGREKGRYFAVCGR